MSATETNGKAQAMWGGRFEGETDALLRSLNDSIGVDWRLLKWDVKGSAVWAEALAGAGVLSERERHDVTSGLASVLATVAGHESSIALSGDEDVHTYVERRLIEESGSVGKKLHTGRSRNDQVATDLRLWTREACAGLIAKIDGLRSALLTLGAAHVETLFPGFTHLQSAQPIVFGHWCHAYSEMFARDAARLRWARDQADACPLGCGALAGSAFPVDREAIARRLGFGAACANSIDAVSDRDFVLDALHAITACALHLSRMAEDLIVYLALPGGPVRIGDAVTTGSSIMPQKRNPDGLELLRAKAARLIGAYTGFAGVLKGVPTAYNKDLQEDKQPLFEAVDVLGACLALGERVVASIDVDSEAARRWAGAGFAEATDLADALARKGVAFRDAHEIVGRVVRLAEQRGVSISSLSDSELGAIDDRLTGEMVGALTLESVVARRDVLGGTAPVRVREAIAGALADVAASARAGVDEG